ncbi:MAG: ParB N-terminal domain-containing protein [Pseudolabrys sp.]|nr:ParB N-terminal domain-containing protein [Pseudolabrys sp.]
MNIELRPTASIRPYENNPRDNDEAVPAVAASIREFGFKVPIAVTATSGILDPRHGTTAAVLHWIPPRARASRR